MDVKSRIVKFAYICVVGKSPAIQRIGTAVSHNLKPNPSDETPSKSPPPPAGFQGNIFRWISKARARAPDSAVVHAEPIFGAARAVHEAEAKLALAEEAQAKAENAASKSETSNKAKSEFLANMSHEIRTPMSAILGLANILLTTKLDDKQRLCLCALQNSAEALMAIANDFLDIDKIESGIVDLKHAPFSVATLLNQTVSIMSVKAQEKGIRLALRYEDKPYTTFIGDSGRIRQIALNLIGNAIKFTETGEVTVTFANDGKGNGKKHISISVKDTGPGIPEDKMDIIFSRFMQADSSIVRNYGGAGLGLAISKALAENMGGSISATSVMGKGSTFVLHLPLLVEQPMGRSEPPPGKIEKFEPISPLENILSCERIQFP
jgi:signal transduction histidine kinase